MLWAIETPNKISALFFAPAKAQTSSKRLPTIKPALAGSAEACESALQAHNAALTWCMLAQKLLQAANRVPSFA